MEWGDLCSAMRYIFGGYIDVSMEFNGRDRSVTIYTYDDDRFRALQNCVPSEIDAGDYTARVKVKKV